MTLNRPLVRPLPENQFSEDDVSGPPEICTRASAVMPDGRVDVLAGGHAPFLDDPARCAELIRDAP